MIESETSAWVKNNIVRLSKEFGALFEGLEKDAESLFGKLHQRRRKSKESSNNYHLILKEVRNLIF